MGFLSGGGDGIKTDIREEHDRRRRTDPVKSIGHEGSPVGRSTDPMPTARKNRITPSLTKTTAQVARALSLTPITRIMVTSRTMMAAGRFAIPPSSHPVHG